LAEDDSRLSAIDISPRPEWLRIERGVHGVEVSCVTENEWRFAAALCAGENFASAMDAATGANAARLFADHIAAGRFVGFRLAEDFSDQPTGYSR
jgi:hypothetical protein